MLSPEAPLQTLVAQLRELPAGDRRAILACLSPEERERTRAALRGVSPKPARRASPYSDDIDARISDGERTDMTDAGRVALAAAVAALRGGSEKPSGSLADAFAGLLRERDPR